MSIVEDMYSGDYPESVKEAFGKVKDYMLTQGKSICHHCGGDIINSVDNVGCRQCPTCGAKNCGD